MLRSKGLVAVDVSLLRVLMQVFVTLFQKAFSSTKLPGRGIRVFAAFLHTHLQGTVIRELLKAWFSKKNLYSQNRSVNNFVTFTLYYR